MTANSVEVPNAVPESPRSLISEQLRGQRILLKPFWLVCILAALIPVQFEIEVPQLSGARLTFQTVGGLMLLGLLGLACSHAPKVNRLLKTPYLTIFAIYLVFSAIAIAKGPITSGWAQGIWTIYRVVFAASLIYIGVWAFVSSSAALRKVFIWLSVGATLSGAVAVLQTLSSGRLLSGLITNHRFLGFLTPLPPEIVAGVTGGLEQLVYLSGTAIFRGHGTFYAPNGFGVLLCTTVFLTWGLLLTTQPFHRWLWAVAITIQLGGLLASFSRSAWAATGAGILFILLLNLFMNRKIALSRSMFLLGTIIMAGVIVGLLVFPTEKILSHFMTILSPAEVGEFSWRTIVWNYSISKIRENPFFGLGTSIIYNSDANVPGSGKLTQYTSHNVWLDVAYQRGVVVAAIFILFSLLAFYATWKILRHGAERFKPEYTLTIGLASGLVAFLVSGVGSSSMQSENLSSLYWLLVISIFQLKVFTRPAL